MADAILSVAVETLEAQIEKMILDEVNLVRGVEKEARSLSSQLAIIRTALDDGESRRFKDKNLNNWLRKLEHIAFEMEDVLDEWSYALRKLKVERGEQQQKKVCSFIPSSSCFSKMEADESNDDVVVAPKVCSFIPSSSCFSFKKVVVRRDIAIKIKDVKEKLDELLKEKVKFESLLSQPTNQIQLDEESKEISRYDFGDHSAKSWRVQSVPSINLAEIHGRESDMNTLVSKVMSSGGGQLGESGSLRILSIVGAGGLGKTTLAQLLYNHDHVEKSFELRIWLCISDPFNEVATAKKIIESVTEGSSPDTEDLPILCKHLIESIKGKTFFLVLDDVWSDDYKKWEPLKNSLQFCGKGSVILVTTRNQEVAEMMGTIDNDILSPGQLSKEDCWLLLSDVALSRRNNEQNPEQWEDITVEEEEDSTTVSLMPSLTKLSIRKCPGLMVLPHRLLRKASSLEELNIYGSTQLQQRYLDKVDSASKSKYPNPHFQFRIYH